MTAFYTGIVMYINDLAALEAFTWRCDADAVRTPEMSTYMRRTCNANATYMQRTEHCRVARGLRRIRRHNDHATFNAMWSRGLLELCADDHQTIKRNPHI